MGRRPEWRLALGDSRGWLRRMDEATRPSAYAPNDDLLWILVVNSSDFYLTVFFFFFLMIFPLLKKDKGHGLTKSPPE